MLADIELRLDEPVIDDPGEFQWIIGSLQFITLTRPEVQVVVNRLAQFMTEPTMVHWVVVKRVLCYLFRTQRHGIVLRWVNDFGITAYCDADWGEDTVDRKSRTGFLVYVGGTLVSWVSRKQSTLARSSTEAEYRAIATTTQEIEAVCSALIELGVEVPRPMVSLSDNLEATFIAKNPIGHIKLKHM